MSAEKPVPEWGLSTAGRARAETFARAELLLKTALIISSAERKAIETAEKGQANGGRTQLIGRFRVGSEFRHVRSRRQCAARQCALSLARSIARTFISANPRRLIPGHCSGFCTRGSSAASPAPQILSTGLASTRTCPPVLTR